jgi:hypothetical protein
MTPPGLEPHYSWSHRSCGARRSRNMRAFSALPRRHSKKNEKGEPPGSLFRFQCECFRASVALNSCDDGGEACYCCAGDGGGHARRPGWPPAAEPNYFAKPTARRKLAARRQRAPARGIERIASRKFSHEKSPVKILNHKSKIKSPQIAFKIVSKFIQSRPTVLAGFFFSCCGARERSSEISDRARLPAEFEPFEPLDGFALVGNDLRLPDQTNGHKAHGNNAKHENETDLGLLSGDTANAAKPSHSKESPSTRSDLLAVARANPSRQRRGV